MLMTIEDNEGQESDLELIDEDEPFIIRFEKHPAEYAQDAAREVTGMIFHSLHVLDVTHGAKEVLIGYLDYIYEGKTIPPGRKMAKACGMSHPTYLKYKRELFDVGLIYKGASGKIISSRNEPTYFYVRDFMVKNFYQRGVVKEFDHPGVVKKFNHSHVQGRVNEGTKALKDSEFSTLNTSDSINTSSSFSKESDVHERDPFTDPAYYETLDGAFDTPVQNVTLSTKPFKLTPPGPPKKKPEKKLFLKKKSRQPVPPAILDRLLAFCYGIETTEQWVTVDKVMLGRCTGAITALTSAGADVTQLGEFIKKWRELNWMDKPSVDMVVRNWFRLMGNTKPIAVTQPKPSEPTQEQISAWLQGRADRELKEYRKEQEARKAYDQTRNR